MDAIKEAGYHVLDLAHNHILDSQIEGVISTADIIEKAGITPIGVYTHEPRDQVPLVIKEVNGIKVALSAYSYGFNGIEQYISQEDYNRYLLDLNEIYSMGNFISNQRIESMGDEENAKWTERGVLMDVTIKKNDGKTTIGTAKDHPTWVNRTPKGTFSPEGYPLYHYQTYILEDFIEDGSHRDQLDEATKERIDTAYKEMNEHVGLKWY